jgi:hypothetical protein
MPGAGEKRGRTQRSVCARWASSLPGRDGRREGVEQRLVELSFEPERAFAGRQGLVFEGLQLGRDVALGILQRLAPAVIVGHLVGLASAHFDEEAVHVVVADLQVADAGALALALFDRGEQAVAVAVDRAQLVERRIVSIADHATVARLRRGLVDERGGQRREERIGQLQ